MCRDDAGEVPGANGVEPSEDLRRGRKPRTRTKASKIEKSKLEICSDAHWHLFQLNCRPVQILDLLMRASPFHSTLRRLESALLATPADGCRLL